ncbi:MAG: formate/nitrite transporter family protein [Planctomycetaceae bacterium]|nr:formate/nitrite transporter family protein [Planctomycetaceae bacterium]
MASKEILRHEVSEAVHALDLPIRHLAASGLSAGMDLGFSVLLIAVIESLSEKAGISSAGATVFRALAYPLGFILVVLGRSELFTEQTALAVLPLLSGNTTFRKVARLWAVVYVTNQIGAVLFALLAIPVGRALGAYDSRALGRVAEYIVSVPWPVMLGSAILAGWLMGLLSWLVAAGRDTISQVVLVYIITLAIGLGGLHHSVLGSTEVLAGVFWSGTSGSDFWRFLLWATLGNAIGGSVMVALVKFGTVYSAAKDT